jgi:hypothetical protein
MSTAIPDDDEIEVVANAVHIRLADSLDRARNCLEHGAPLGEIGDHLDRSVRLLDVLRALAVAGTGPTPQDAIPVGRGRVPSQGRLRRSPAPRRTGRASQPAADAATPTG